MVFISKELSEISTKVHKQLTIVEQELKQLPLGRLVCENQGGRLRFVNETYDNGKRRRRNLPPEDPMLITELLEYFNDGYTYIVDIDLEKFFDNVPQDKLMTLVHNIINDPDTESIIRKYLNAGVMVRGQYEPTTKGTPQTRGL